jgi:hypothetical protein
VDQYYRAVLAYYGVAADEGAEAAREITKEFAEHRKHYRNCICAFEKGTLVLSCESDFDPLGLNLMDEFSDCISAYIKTTSDGDLRLISSEKV